MTAFPISVVTRRELEQMLVLRGYAQTNYTAKSWKIERRVCARIETTELARNMLSENQTWLDAEPGSN